MEFFEIEALNVHVTGEEEIAGLRNEAFGREADVHHVKPLDID
jgi:hypothetical protein